MQETHGAVVQALALTRLLVLEELCESTRRHMKTYRVLLRIVRTLAAIV